MILRYLNTRSIGNDKSRIRASNFHLALVLFKIVISNLQVCESTHCILRRILVSCCQSEITRQQDIFILIISYKSVQLSLRHFRVVLVGKISQLLNYCYTFP